MAPPFRWNFARREQLGSWIDKVDGYERPDEAFMDDLRSAAAWILALSDGADLAFIGRTPENFYDYLSGCFESVQGAPSVTLVPFSMRWVGDGGAAAIAPHTFAGLRETFEGVGIAPSAIAVSPAPLALVDFVAWGGTMESLVSCLHRMADEEGTDWRAVQRRLRIIGIRTRTKNSPNTWRWQQKQDWLGLIPDTVIKNISAPARLTYYLANYQEKVTPSFHSGRWNLEDEGATPPYNDQRKAMKLAADLYDLGRTAEERERLVRKITARPEMKQPATRALVARLRGR